MTRGGGTSRLLAIHSGALGDVLLLGQLLDAVASPGQTTAVAAGGAKARLLADLGVADEAIGLESLPMHEVFQFDRPVSTCDLAERLGRCDRLVSVFAAGEVEAEKRLAAICGASEATFLPARPGKRRRRHVLDVWADRLGLTHVDPPRWSATGAMVAEAGQALERVGIDSTDPFVSMHVGSGSPLKCWPVEAFETLADTLGRPTVFLLGPVERERLHSATVTALRRRRAVLGEITLTCLAGVLATATVFVGNDSGPTHLAAALQTSTVALFGPTDPAQFAPRGRSVTTLRGRPLSALPIERVAEGAIEMLGGRACRCAPPCPPG